MDAIVAVYADWGIGAKGTQPLVSYQYGKEDYPSCRKLLRYALTTVCVLAPVLFVIEGAQVVHSPAEAAAAAAQYDRCFVIGGDSVFRQMFPHLTRVYVTKIDSAPHSDVFFPDLDADPAWRCVSSEPRAEHDGVGYQFCVYEKVKE